MKEIFFKWKKQNMIIFFCILCTSLFQVTSSSMLTQLLDTVLMGQIKKVVMIFALLLTLWLGAFLFEFLYSVLQAGVIRKIKLDFRGRVTAYIAGMDYQEFNSRKIGDYVSWYTNDFMQLEQKALVPFYGIQYKACCLTFTFLAIVRIHGLIAVLMALVGLILVVSPRIFAGRIQKGAENLSLQQEIYTGEMKWILGGFLTAKVFQRTPLFTDKSQKAGEGLEKKNYQMSVINVQAQTVLGILNVMGQFACTAVTALLAANQLISYGTVLAVGTLSGLFFNSFQLIVDDVMTLSAGKVFVGKFHFPEKQQDNRTQLPSVKKEIELKDISYSYGDKPVLHQVSMVFEKGKKYALSGPSGCGKSTLLKLMIGYLKDYQGSITFDGKDQKEFAEDSLTRQMAYIDQNTYLFPGTVRENITLFQDTYSSEEIREALRNSALEEFMEPGLLNKEVGEDGKNLSGGQRQRVAIARALLQKKSVIIMDEGTSALDRENARIVEEQLLRNKELTVILISHNIQDQMKGLFDRIYQMGEGKNI